MDSCDSSQLDPMINRTNVPKGNIQLQTVSHYTAPVISDARTGAFICTHHFTAPAVSPYTVTSAFRYSTPTISYASTSAVIPAIVGLWHTQG